VLPADVEPASVPEGVPLLAARDVSKHFGGVAAVRDVTLEFPAGSVTAIVGDNGAGKSTFMKMLCGVHVPDQGTIEVRGQPVRLASPAAAHELGIETVHQDLALADHRDVAQNLFLGREVRRRFGPLQLLDVARMRREAETSLRDLRIKLPSVRQEVRKLSGGQRQGVAIARAVHWGSRILLLDEPMAALGLQEQARVQELIADLASRHLTIVIVSHNLEHVFALSTRIAVMRLGRLVGVRDTATSTPVEILHLISGIPEAR
jgi:simple sugar transport system ATP-binding protein